MKPTKYKYVEAAAHYCPKDIDRLTSENDTRDKRIDDVVKQFSSEGIAIRIQRSKGYGTEAVERMSMLD